MKTICIETIWLDPNHPKASALREGAVVSTAPVSIGAGPGVEGETLTADVISWSMPVDEAQPFYDTLCNWMQQHAVSARHICVRMLHASD